MCSLNSVDFCLDSGVHYRLSLFGVAKEQALAVGIVFHVLLIIPSTAYALLLLSRSGLTFDLIKTDFLSLK